MASTNIVYHAMLANSKFCSFRYGLIIKLFILLVLVGLLWKFYEFQSRPAPAIANETRNIEQKNNVNVAFEKQESVEPVAVVVYYEALCPDSRYFILHQLWPAYEKAARLMNIELVPYGKAHTKETPKGHYKFACQHGPPECRANMIHACGIKHVTDTRKRMEYINCMISDNLDPDGAGQKCAERLGLKWNIIYRCAGDMAGELLMKEYGELTHGLKPKVTFIPTITLNGSQDNQKQILKNFLRALCNLFSDEEKPFECR